MSLASRLTRFCFEGLPVASHPLQPDHLKKEPHDVHHAALKNASTT
jgi:hypothetical protein